MAKRDDIAERIERLIISGEMPPGSELPKLEALATAFHVAVNTMRQSLLILERKELLVLRAGVRARVRTPGETSLGRQDVIDLLRGRIDSGELRPGDLLPSRAEMAAEYGISESTAKMVVKGLREAGLVTMSANGQERRVAGGAGASTAVNAA